MTNENEVKVEEIAKGKPGLFTSRLSGKVVDCDGVSFYIRALPSLVVTYIRGQASTLEGNIQTGIVNTMYVRFGIENIVGLTDEAGEAVPVILEDINPIKFGADSPTLMGISEDVLNRIKPDWYTLLFYEIVTLTHMMPGGKEKPTPEHPDGKDKLGEKEKLDFTGASDSPGPTATDGAE
jgi:hypothetical protein